MSNKEEKLLLVIYIHEQEDLAPIISAEGWYTVKDLLRKTDTSYNTDWNGKFVIDLDETPWKATQNEMDSLGRTTGSVVCIADGDYRKLDKVTIFLDKDGSAYVREGDVGELIDF
jgi:hypothetical protein